MLTHEVVSSSLRMAEFETDALFNEQIPGYFFIFIFIIFILTHDELFLRQSLAVVQTLNIYCSPFYL